MCNESFYGWSRPSLPFITTGRVYETEDALGRPNISNGGNVVPHPSRTPSDTERL